MTLKLLMMGHETKFNSTVPSSGSILMGILFPVRISKN